MDDIIWEKPPQVALDAQTVHRSQYGELALALRERKGEWARVPREFASMDSARNTATNMRRGVVKGFIKGEYEAIAHDKQIWVRWIGPKGAQETPEPEPSRTVTRPPEPEEDDYGVNDAKAFPARVRSWAQLNGRQVPSRGRLPEALIAEYEEATQDYRPGALKIVR